MYGSGCGVAGGHPTEVRKRGHATRGVAIGVDGKELPKAKLGPAKRTVGGVAEVAWAMAANHGRLRVQAVQSRRRGERGGVPRGAPRVCRRQLLRPVSERHQSLHPSRWSRPGPPPPGLSGRETAYPPVAPAREPTTCAARPSPPWRASITARRGTSRSTASPIARARRAQRRGARARGAPRSSSSTQNSRIKRTTMHTPGSGRACGEWSVLDEVRVPGVWRPARTCCRGVGTARRARRFGKNCADVELVATDAEAEWHLASAEALARVPKPEKAAAAKFDPYKDATGDGKNSTATNRWRLREGQLQGVPVQVRKRRGFHSS